MHELKRSVVKWSKDETVNMKADTSRQISMFEVLQKKDQYYDDVHQDKDP